MTTIPSFAGGSLGIIILVGATPLFLEFALLFKSKEYFVALLLGLVMAATVSPGSATKGLASLALGVLFGLVGADVQIGVPRFTFGRMEFFAGINIVVIVAMGLFGISPAPMPMGFVLGSLLEETSAAPCRSPAVTFSATSPARST